MNMGNFFEAYGWFIILTGFAFVILITWLLAKKRKEALMRFAQSRGLTYAAEESPMQNTHLSLFPLFQQGHEPTFQNVMQGYVDGQDIKLFDYHYTTGSRKSRSTYAQTVIVFNIDKELPYFELRPEHFLDKIGALVGYDDIDFHEDQQFSKSYLLKGKDKTAVQLLFHLNIRNYFLKSDKWCVEGGGKVLLIYKNNKTIKVDLLPQFLNQTLEIFRLFS